MAEAKISYRGDRKTGVDEVYGGLLAALKDHQKSTPGSVMKAEKIKTEELQKEEIIEVEAITEEVKVEPQANDVIIKIVVTEEFKTEELKLFRQVAI